MTKIDYTDILVGAKKSQRTIEDCELMLIILAHAQKPMSAKELGVAILGDEYTQTGTQVVARWDGHDITRQGRSDKAMHWSSFIGRMMKILSKKGLVKVEMREEAPITIEVEDWVDSPDAPPEFLIVHDDEGNDYKMRNPKYDLRTSACRWETIQKTIIPKTRVYSWVG